MPTAVADVTSTPVFNRKATYSLIAVAVLYVAAVVYVYVEWRRPVAYASVGIPLAVFLVTQPKLALYQFVFCLYIHILVIPGVPLFAADLSALVVIATAAIDILVSDRLPKGLPAPGVNFILLLVVMFFSAAFGANMLAAVRPMSRVLLLLLTFLAVYRLSRHTGVGRVLRVYFWFCAAHAFIVMGPFVASGGLLRSFGYSWAVFDDLAMLALPIGLALSIWERRRRYLYLGGTVMVLAALVATQSRAPIVFALVISMVALWLSRRRARRMLSSAVDGERQAGAESLRRIRLLLLSGLVLVVAVAIVVPGLFTGVISRFERLLTFRPGGTFAIRLVLWGWAVRAFADNPLLGVGPGIFRSLGNLYTNLHMTPLHIYVRQLSAHNLTLHYLAETGLLGAAALLSIFVRQYLLARRVWRTASSSAQQGTALAVYAAGLMFLVTTLIEAGWMWSQTGFMMAFFLAVISRQGRGSVCQRDP